MTLTELAAALATLDPVDFDRIAASFATDDTVDEIDAWHATMAIDRALRHAHRGREAARAAWEAAQAVQHAATRQGLRLPDPRVTHVARAAAEIARGIVAGDVVEGQVRYLLNRFAVVPALA